MDQEMDAAHVLPPLESRVRDAEIQKKGAAGAFFTRRIVTTETHIYFCQVGKDGIIDEILNHEVQSVSKLFQAQRKVSHLDHLRSLRTFSVAEIEHDAFKKRSDTINKSLSLGRQVGTKKSGSTVSSWPQLIVVWCVGAGQQLAEQRGLAQCRCRLPKVCGRRRSGLSESVCLPCVCVRCVCARARVRRSAFFLLCLYRSCMIQDHRV